MDEVNFKDIRVLPGALDLKGNAQKNLSEILTQLQTGYVLKGLVVGNTPKGEIIFHTGHGRFIAPNTQNLKRGDTISIRINNNANILEGSIIKINNQNQETRETIVLDFAQPTPKVNEKLNTQATNLNLNISDDIPKILSGKITYLNLSKISKESALYKELAKIDPQQELPKIVFQVKTAHEKINSPFTILAEISSGSGNKQLVKTDFGIINIENSKIPDGKKLNLEIISIDNKQINVNISKDVSSFVLNIGKNIAALQNLIVSSKIKNILPQNVPQNVENKNQNNPLLPKQQPLQATINNAVGQVVNPRAQQGGEQGAMNNNIAQFNIQPIASPEQLKKILQRSNTYQETGKIKNNTNKDKTSNLDSYSKQDVKAPENMNLNKALKSLGASIEEIKQIRDEYAKVKELLVPNVKLEDKNQEWQTIIVPFFNGDRVEEREIKISKLRENYLRFLFNLTLQDENNLQLDGLVKFKENSKIPTDFDMTFRSERPLDQMLQKKISDIFLNNQAISGIKGQMHFEDL